jgi:hypothetical protein
MAFFFSLPLRGTHKISIQIGTGSPVCENKTLAISRPRCEYIWRKQHGNIAFSPRFPKPSDQTWDIAMYGTASPTPSLPQFNVLKQLDSQVMRGILLLSTNFDTGPFEFDDTISQMVLFSECSIT